MAGNRSVACSEGRLSLARERGEARKKCADLELYSRRAQYPVAGWPEDPFKLCDFPLVTLISVLY